MKPLRILVVDDDVIDARQLDRLLQAGTLPIHNLEAASCLAEAKICVETGDFDVLFVDFHLPDSDGLATIGELRALNQEAAIIAMTDVQEQIAEARKLEHGADGYLTKGRNTPEQIQSVVIRAIDSKRQYEDFQRECDFARGLLETTQAIILVLDKEGRIVLFNAFMEKLSGYALAEVLGGDWFNLFLRKQDRESVRALFEQSTKGVTVSGNIGIVVTKANEEKAIEWHERVLRDAQGECIGLLCFGNDITDRYEAEHDLCRARDMAAATSRELEQVKSCLDLTMERVNVLGQEAVAANRAKCHFLDNVTHEIRTPLNAILGFSDLLAQAQLDPVYREYLSIIQESGQSLATVITSILDISRLEADRFEIHTMDCSLPGIINVVAEMFRVKMEAKGLLFTVQTQESLPQTIHTDPVVLRQCLISLLENAFKFTGQGQIDFTIQVVKDEGKKNLQFDVADTGIGIPEDKQSTLFDPFVQGDGAWTRKFEGAGLGLAITKKLVRRLGGDVTARNRTEQGARFVIRIPLPSGSSAEGGKTPDRTETHTEAMPLQSDAKPHDIEAQPPTPSNEVCDSPVIDWDTFKEIYGRMDVVQEIIDAFLDESTSTMSRIVLAVRNEKVGEVRMWAHKLKGSALTISAGPLAAVAYRLECAAEHDDLGAFSHLLKELESAYRSLLAYILTDDYQAIGTEATGVVPTASPINDGEDNV